jgi:hypothetical protein
MTTATVNMSTDEYVRVNVSNNPILLQAHRDTVRIVLADVKPARDTSAFIILSGSSEPLPLTSLDTNVWALATSENSSLVAHETDIRANARTFTSDLLFDVAKGLVPGHKLIFIHSYASSIGNTQSLVWPLNAPITYNDTATMLYLSCAAADTHFVNIVWLDADYVEQTNIVQLNGQTPVPIGVGLRVNNMTTIGVDGVAGNVYVSNALTHTGGVPTVETTVAMYEPKSNARAMAAYTVPAGHTVFGISGYFSSPKGRDNDFYWNIRNPVAQIPPINTNVLSVYQSTIEVDFKLSPVYEKTDAYFTSKSETGSGRVSLRIPILQVDNNFL